MKESAFSRYLGKFEAGVVTVALIGMIIAILIQVLFRSLSSLDFEFMAGIQRYLTSTLMWTEEVARYLMVWAVFFGASLGAKKNIHVGIEAAIALFPKAMGRYVFLLSGIISTIFCLLICYYGYQVAVQIVARGQVSPAMEMPMGWVYASVPIATAIMGYRFLQAAIIKFKTYDAGQGV